MPETPLHEDTCADFVLHLARLQQEHLRPTSSLVGWVFLPAFREATWSQARELLAAAPKPLVVAPLVEPGYLAVWNLDGVEPDRRATIESLFANQVEYFTEKLKICGLGQTAVMRLSTPTVTLSISAADFRRWFHEYTVFGVTVAKTGDPGVGRVLIRPPGGGGPPLGLDPADL